MTCKNCISYDKCSALKIDFAYSANPNYICKYFKNKNKYVEVVRCENCKYWDDGRCESIKNGLIREYTSSDDFCSYGERRCDNEN